MRAETRHQLKADAFSRVTIGAAEKTAHWSVEHRNTLIVAGIIVAVLAALALGGWYYMSQQNEKASLDLAQAVRTLDAQIRAPGATPQPDVPSFASVKERAEAARKQFQAIVDKYPHTQTADMAKYFVGVTSESMGDSSAAEKNLKDVASEGSKDMAAMAKLALAGYYSDVNRPKDAIALYQEIINKPTPTVSKITAELQLAELYQANNQPVDAKRLYEQIKRENPGPEATQLVNQRLSELK